MELMNTIAGIERYAAAEGDVGMFITLTAPSKYHPTRQVGKGESKTVQLNHGWNDEAFNPKDAQRYLCHIWSLMRTAFKDNDLQVYGLRVVEPHHDGTPHWHMMLFCNPRQRNQIIEIMRRYALKEDGDERGAARNRFQAKHLNRGGAAGYIAKYISKNIDGYALDGQLDNDTGRPLKDTAAAVTAWASTWRIPQFKTVGLPTMGAYRELRKLPRGVSIADEFDERVEAARAAADSGDFALYISAQGGANVPRDCQTVRVARSPSDDVNEYEEEVERVVGIYAPHLGARHCFIGFATGTSWGTIGIMVPLVCAVFDWYDQSTLLSIGLAASCAGGVCGDHLSPISDTTIMASAGAHCFHLNHVSTQIPYGVTVAAVSFVSFIIAGLVQNVVVCMIIAVALMIGTLLVIKAVTAKKHPGIFQEMANAGKAMAK